MAKGNKEEQYECVQLCGKKWDTWSKVEFWSKNKKPWCKACWKEKMEMDAAWEKEKEKKAAAKEVGKTTKEGQGKKVDDREKKGEKVQ